MRHHFHRCGYLRVLELDASDLSQARKGGHLILEELCEAKRLAPCLHGRIVQTPEAVGTSPPPRLRAPRGGWLRGQMPGSFSRRIAGSCALAALGTSLVADPAVAAPVFMGLGDLLGGSFDSFASDVSADGRVVVGTSLSSDGAHAFRWTLETGMQDLGRGQANGISADGSVIVGAYASAGTLEAFRWTSEGGMQLLGDIPGGRHSSVANAVSADGSVVVGQGDSGVVGTIDYGDEIVEVRSFGEAFRWTAESGMQPLGLVRPDPTYGDYGSFATGVSADGRIIVGGGTVGDTFPDGGDADRYDSGLLWVDGSGPLIPPVGICCESIFTGISPDGSTIAGGVWQGGGGGGFWAIRLPDGSVVEGGTLPEESPASTANLWDVSLDGEVFVGGFTQDETDAFLLLEGGSKFHLLDEYVTSVLGLDISGWDLREAVAVSWDGKTIVGWGTNPSGRPEAWLLIVPEPSVAQLLWLGLLALASAGRRTARSSRSGAFRMAARRAPSDV